jgi:hypothetical protein
VNRFLKKIAQTFLDWSVIPAVRYVGLRTSAPTVLTELKRMTAVECADFVRAEMRAAIQFERKEGLWDHALKRVPPDGIVAEFGVWSGYSINHIAGKLKNRVVFGFDSFEGLREDWAGSDLEKGHFDLGGRLPGVEPNVRLVKGWFDNTVPAFLSETPGLLAFVHVDCDTYEGADCILKLIGDRLRVGTILVFDEYFGYPGWKTGEFKAWQECVQERGVEFVYLAFTVQSVSVRITAVPP